MVFLSGGGSPIDLDGTFFVQIVIFFIAFFALKALVFRPMMRLLEAREQAIDGTRAEAKGLKEGAQKKAAEFDEKLHSVRLAAGDEREKLRQEGLKLERSILERARTDSQALLATANTKLAAEATHVRRDLQTKVPEIAREIAARLLGREVR